MNKKRVLIVLLIVILGVGFLTAKDGSFTIIHMNDTHSHLLAGSDEFKNREFGGAARWKTIIDEIRGDRKDVLTLHGATSSPAAVVSTSPLNRSTMIGSPSTDGAVKPMCNCWTF